MRLRRKTKKNPCRNKDGDTMGEADTDRQKRRKGKSTRRNKAESGTRRGKRTHETKEGGEENKKRQKKM